MHSYTLSKKGKRKTNQDYIISKSIGPDLFLHLIADGMGGYEDGDVAAKIVAETVATSLSLSNKVNYQDQIIEAVSIANTEIQRIATAENKKLGATIGGILLSNNFALCFWVGDVKI